MEMIPGMNSKETSRRLILIKVKKQLDKSKAIIHSMTPKERKNPKLIVGIFIKKEQNS